MGKRDYRWREKKKPKKDAKKITATVLPPPVEVEVIRKVRKREEEEGQKI
jgi:hypothetical protein